MSRSALQRSSRKGMARARGCEPLTTRCVPARRRSGSSGMPVVFDRVYGRDYVIAAGQVAVLVSAAQGLSEVVEPFGFDQAVERGRVCRRHTGSPLERPADEDRAKAQSGSGMQIGGVRGNHSGILGRAVEQAKGGEVHLGIGLVAGGELRRQYGINAKVSELEQVGEQREMAVRQRGSDVLAAQAIEPIPAVRPGPQLPPAPDKRSGVGG